MIDSGLILINLNYRSINYHNKSMNLKCLGKIEINHCYVIEASLEESNNNFKNDNDTIANRKIINVCVILKMSNQTNHTKFTHVQKIEKESLKC